MRAHDRPVVALGELCSLNRLRDCADLVDLEEETVARLLLNGSLDSQRVGDSQVVTNDSDTAVGGEVRPSLPVVLVEGVLDGRNGVLLDPAEVEVSELLSGDELYNNKKFVSDGNLDLILITSHTHVRVLLVLEVEVVLALLVELGAGHVEGDVDLASVASLLDGLGEDLEGLVGTLKRRCKATLVTDVGSVDARASLDDLLEVVVNLGTDLHGLGEGLGAGGDDHELLRSELVASVRATVDDVHGGGGENVRALDTGKSSNVLVEGNAVLLSTGLGNGDGDTEDGVGTELGLVGGAVKLDEEVVDGLLVSDLEARLDELGSDDVVDVGNGLGDTLAHVRLLVAIPELVSLVDTGRSTTGHSSAEEACAQILDNEKVPLSVKGTSTPLSDAPFTPLLTLLGPEVDLDGGVTTRVEDLTGENLLNRHVV